MSAPEVFGLVLAGGHSRRFGRDKAVVSVAGEVLLDRTVRLLEQCLSRVYVSARAEQKNEPYRNRHALILDRYTGLGPASGILSAHAEYPQAAWLVVACDLPQLDRQTVDTLLQARTAGCPAVAYKSVADGLPEPLCALYEPGTLARFRERIEQGAKPGARGLLMDIDARLVDLQTKNALHNMNTPGELP